MIQQMVSMPVTRTCYFLILSYVKIYTNLIEKNFFKIDSALVFTSEEVHKLTNCVAVDFLTSVTIPPL
jgi:hypothetical protein